MNKYQMKLEARKLLEEKLQSLKQIIIALKIYVDNCEKRIDDIIDIIEKYCKEEKKIDNMEKVIEKYIENIIDNIFEEKE